MTMLDYKEVVEHTLSRIGEIIRQKSDLDTEATKLAQLLFAAVNMLADEEKAPILKKWHDLFQNQLNRESSLIDATRKALRESPHQWLTVKAVRDQLIASGFDFSGYMSNPLASVSATLSRLKEKKEVEVSTIEGVGAFRWKKRGHRLADAVRQAKLATMSNEQLIKYADEFLKSNK